MSISNLGRGTCDEFNEEHSKDIVSVNLEMTMYNIIFFYVDAYTVDNYHVFKTIL